MDEIIDVTKKNLRATVFKKRAGLSERAVALSNRLIAERLYCFAQFKTAQVIFCYASVAGEVATDEIILESLAQGKRICLPRCEKLGIMHAYEIHRLEDLVEGMYGIREPAQHCQLVSPQELDLAIVPCVSCTEEGQRLGYGGGFYDRYLADRDFPAVALCREALLLDTIPSSPHDVIMDAVITETETLVNMSSWEGA